MLLVVIVQAAVFAGTISATNVSGSLSDNSFALFAKTVESRKNFLETDMLNRWSDIELFQVQIEEEYNRLLMPNSTFNQERTLSFLNNSTEVIAEMISHTEASGGFIILNDGIDGGSNNALYFIFPSTNASYTSLSDLQLLYGPSEIRQSYEIPLSNAWSYGMLLDENTLPILENPISAVEVTTENEHRGYWHLSPSSVASNAQTLTYTLPLIDENGEAFGVIGTEITQDKLYKLLPFDELTIDDELGYFLATKKFDGDGNEIFTPMMSQGTVQTSILSIGEPLDMMPASSLYDAYVTDSAFGGVAITLSELDLYGNNTPFESETLYLGRLTAFDNIYEDSQRLETTLIIMVILSVTVGTFAAYFIGIYFTSPIVKLSRSVTDKKIGEEVNIPKIGITEIDNLAYAIERLNNDVLDSTNKTDKILDMMKMGVGSFEHNSNAKIVKISSSLYRMLDFLDIDEEKLTISEDKFFEFIDDLRERPDENLENTYKQGEDIDKYLQVTISYKDEGILGVIIDVTKEVHDRQALNYERDFDLLTGLNNRLAFHRKAGAVISRGNLGVAAIAMFDLDNLKYVNDTFGHDLGDIYIKSAATILRKTFSVKAITGRMSGDEFFIFYYAFEEKSEVLKLVDKLYETLDSEPIILPDGSEFKIRMSGGISWYGDDSSDLAELIRFADFAMYEGKHTLKGELRIFDKEKYRETSFMLEGKEELNRILDNQFVDFHFQPIVRADGSLYAYEALMRPNSELINTPVKLLQIAKSQSQLWRVERLTFFKSLSTYQKHSDRFGDAKLFINSVPNQVLKDSEYEEIERQFGALLVNVVVEIIESEQLDVEGFERKLAKIKEWGGKIALDDYGSGYNNDLNLLKIKPNVLKIDRSIIENVEHDVSRQAIVAKAIDYCKERDILVLAEGIETKIQMDYLVSVGVDLLQGYFISRPTPLPGYVNEFNQS